MEQFKIMKNTLFDQYGKRRIGQRGGSSGSPQRGFDWSAGFDVLTTEPPKDGNPLLDLKLPNFILTPHVAWASDEAQQFLADQLIDNVELFVQGNPQHLVV